MSEEHDADAAEENRRPFSMNRRRFVRSLSAAGSIGVFGIGTTRVSAEESPVPRSRAADIVQREVSQVALKTAGIQPDTDSFDLDEATGNEIDGVRWIQIPVEEADLFAYNTREDAVEIKLSSEEFLRAESGNNGITVEELKTGEEVTKEGLRILENSADWYDALEKDSIVTVNTEEADAHLDRTSGIIRVFIPAELRNGSGTLLIAEIDGENSLDSVYSFSGESEGITIQQSAIDCFTGCITFGVLCATVCTPCVSVPNQFTCAPCAVCLGATGVRCAVECGAEQLL